MPSILDFLAPYVGQIGGGGIMSQGQPTYGGSREPSEDAPTLNAEPLSKPDPLAGVDSWKAQLPGLIGTAVSGLAGHLAGGHGLDAMAGFAKNYANVRHQQIQQKREQEFQTQKAVGDAAHKVWQDLQGADLSKLPPNLSHLAQQKAEFDQKYAQAIAKDGINPREAQELIALGSVIKSAMPEVEQFSKQATQAEPYTRAIGAGTFEPPPGAEQIAELGLGDEDATRLAGIEAMQNDALTRFQRESLGTKSPEALEQEYQQQQRFKNIRPDPVSLGAPAEGYLLGGKPVGGTYSEEDIEILQAKRAAEESRRTTLAAVTARGAARQDRWNALDPNLPEIKAAIRNAADRYANGEITWQQGLQTLGGVHGKLGPHFSAAVGERMGLPRHLRDKISSLDQSSEVIDQLEELANRVKAAPTLEAKIEASVLLENYTLSRAGMLARGYSAESGQITDRDVGRATALAPGWKAANFNPDFIDQELAVLRRGIDLQRKAVTSGYFGEYRRDDVGNVVKTPFGPPPTMPGARPATAEEYLKKLRGQ